MECVKTCAYDNVAVFWRSRDGTGEVASYGEAWQAIVMFALACLYCFINLGAWDRIRDWTDLLDKQNWGTFSVYAVAVWVVCLGVLPLLWYLLTRAGVALGRSTMGARSSSGTTTAALIPIGLGCWIAFALATVLSMMTFVLQSLSDPFNWGWNLLGMAGSRWHIIWSSGHSVAAGGLRARRGRRTRFETLYHCWLASGRDAGRCWGSSAGSFLWAAAAGMIWFFAGLA